MEMDVELKPETSKCDDDHYSVVGYCPECHKEGAYLNVEKCHWAICDACKTTWPIGVGLFSSWQEETMEDWQRNAELICSFKEVKPWHPFEGC